MVRRAATTEAPQEYGADLFDFGRDRRRQTDAELIRDLRAFAAVFPPAERTAANYRLWPRKRFHDHTICAQLGGWIEALRRAGVEYGAREARGATRAEVEEDLRRFSKVTPAAERTRYGSWRGGVEG
jgi:hypothetical protein